METSTYWASITKNLKAKTTKTFVMVDVLSTKSQSGSLPSPMKLRPFEIFSPYTSSEVTTLHLLCHSTPPLS